MNQWCELYKEFVFYRLSGDEKGIRRCIQNMLTLYKEIHGENEDFLRIKKTLLLYPEDVSSAVNELEWLRNTLHWECRHSNVGYFTNHDLDKQVKKLSKVKVK